MNPAQWMLENHITPPLPTQLVAEKSYDHTKLCINQAIHQFHMYALLFMLANQEQSIKKQYFKLQLSRGEKYIKEKHNKQHTEQYVNNSTQILQRQMEAYIPQSRKSYSMAITKCDVTQGFGWKFKLLTFQLATQHQCETLPV